MWREPTSVWWVEKSPIHTELFHFLSDFRTSSQSINIGESGVFNYLSLEQDSFLHISTWFGFGFLHSLNIYWFFFRKATKKGSSCFILFGTLPRNIHHFRKSHYWQQYHSCIWWPIKMINESQYHTLMVVAFVAITFMVILVDANSPRL